VLAGEDSHVKDARISTAFPAHPKTKKLARRLGPAGVLGCVYLFLWAASNRSDGDLSGMTDEDIELAVDWSGEPGAFVSAAAEVGYLDGEERSRTIHDWSEHNPWAAGSDLRSDRARWANLIRHHGQKEAARLMPEYAERIGSGRVKDQATVLDPPNRSDVGESRTPPLPSPSPSPIQEQDQNQKPKAQRAARSTPVVVDVPDWIPGAAWSDFVGHRKAMRKPLTQRAAELAIKSLADLRRQGHDPTKVIEQSITSGWTGLFPTKSIGGTHEAHRNLSAVERVREANARARADRGEPDVYDGSIVAEQ